MKWFHFKPFHPSVSRAALIAGCTTIGAQQALLQQIVSTRVAAGITVVCLVIAAFSKPAMEATPPASPPPPELSGHA